MNDKNNQKELDVKSARLLSVVIPAYNEEEVLETFHERISKVFEGRAEQVEFIYINDGSGDRTLPLLKQLREKDNRICIIDLSRNFGKEIAMTAGLDAALGDAVVVIDADLQDPPELIPELISEWHDGYDVVYARRAERKGETMVKKATAHAFYRLMGRIGEVPVPEDVGDYRLLSRRAVDALSQLRERHRFMKGLFSWIGYPQKELVYYRDARHAGNSKWSYWRLWNFALEGITSFTTMPLRIATYAGVVTALVAFLFGLYIIFDTLVHGNPVAGYPSLIVVMLFLGGIQLITLGIIGEYLGRMFNESKQRPLYLLKDLYPSQNRRPDES